MFRKALIPLSLLALAAIGLVFHQLYLDGGDVPASYRLHAKVPDGTARLVFISDTQAPLWVETLRLEEHDNEAATDRLFSLIAEEEVDAVCHLGDLTAVGSSARAWAAMDRRLALLEEAKLSFYPIFGNHDYMMRAATARKNFFDRFPYTDPSWYCLRHDGLAVVMLNSNFEELANERAQRTWYGRVLDALEKEEDIRAVIVACHHAPFTNSAIHGPSEGVLKRFVPPYLAHEKCRLFLSGHSHAFEHFTVEGKTFMVIGGGGGLLHPLLSGEERRTEDRFAGHRMGFFHYLRCTLQDGCLEVAVIRLDGKVAYRVEIEE